jgi:hypothetical protein
MLRALKMTFQHVVCVVTGERGAQSPEQREHEGALQPHSAELRFPLQEAREQPRERLRNSITMNGTLSF